MNDAPNSPGPQPGQLGTRTTTLLVWAGSLVTAGTFTEVALWTMIVNEKTTVHTWGARIYAPLALMLAAIAVGCVAVLRRDRENDQAVGIHQTLRRPWMLFSFLIIIHIAFAFLFCKPGSSPRIDTFTFQRDACKSLVQGIDPFGSTQANVFDAYQTTLFFGPGMVVNGRVQVGFQYPPLTLLWVLPGYLLGDVRLSYILAIVISAMLWFRIRSDKGGLAIVAVLLLSPVTFLVEDLCWTEPLVLMMLSATIYAAVKKRWWLPIALGLFLATKQYNFLALPFIGYFVRPFQWKACFKLAGTALAVAVATILPFAVWNLRGLWHDLVLFHLAQPFRADAASFAVPFPWMLKVGPLLLLAFIVGAIMVGTRNAAMFAAAYATALLLFVATNKQAFPNYYFLIGVTFFLAALALPVISTPPDVQQPGEA